MIRVIRGFGMDSTPGQTGKEDPILGRWGMNRICYKNFTKGSLKNALLEGDAASAMMQALKIQRERVYEATRVDYLL